MRRQLGGGRREQREVRWRRGTEGADEDPPAVRRYRVTGGPVCVRGGVRVFGEEVQPVLQIALTVARHLHPLALPTC